MPHSHMIFEELEWIERVIKHQISVYFQSNEQLYDTTPPALQDSHYSTFLKEYNVSEAERKVIALALSVEIAPEKLDIFLTKNKLYDAPFSEFGGTTSSEYNSFIPTLQTALFILAGAERTHYIDALKLFEQTNTLFAQNILDRHELNPNLSLIHNRLSLSKSALHYLLYGCDINYEYSKDFPATLLQTTYEWDDLVLNDYTAQHLQEIEMWLKHGNTLLEDWGMAKYIKQGYKALFYGSSGTGKTLTASLLGKRFNKPVYRVDLSQVVSKYIGETEKNLEKIFQRSEQKDWILFFDEADALFGKRGAVNNSNDKYANQETAYLLQRVEESPSLIILATNLKDNFDEAFLRRFQSIIYFPVPDERERLRLWQKGFSQKADLQEVDLETLARRYELSGANIMNIIRAASLMAINNESYTIKQEDIITGIRREKYKEGKII